MYTLGEEIDISGEWWLPGTDNSHVSGVLKFGSNGMELHINQSFSPPSGAIRPGDPNPKYPVVHGVTVKGEAVTLFDAQEFGTSFNFGSGGLRQPGRIYAHAIAFGAHLPAGFHFAKMRFRTPGLAVWLGHQVISESIIFDPENKLRFQSYNIQRIPDESFRVSSIDASISLSCGWSSKADAYNSVRVDVSAWFSFLPEQPQSIDWFLEQQTKFLTLLSLLSGHVFVSDAIQATFDESNHRADILLVGHKVKDCDFKHPVDFFLSKPTLSKPLGEITAKWFEVVKDVEKPASLARSILGSESLWLHVEFLSLMQALEGFHRALYDGNYMQESEYAEVKSALTSAIPTNVKSDHKDALKSRIRYGNQISLRKRLNELTGNLSPQLQAHIFGTDNGVPRSWIDTRNYYTHWDDDLLSNVLDTQSMYYANERMKHLLRALYARLVGVNANVIDSAFHGPSRIAQQLVHMNIVQKRQADPKYVPQAIMTISSGESSDEAALSGADSDAPAQE